MYLLNKGRGGGFIFYIIKLKITSFLMFLATFPLFSNCLKLENFGKRGFSLKYSLIFLPKRNIKLSNKLAVF